MADKGRGLNSRIIGEKVDRMHCSNCALRIENAFNSTAGRWAKADLENSEVRLLSKHEETQQDLSDVVSSAGYVMLSYKTAARQKSDG